MGRGEKKMHLIAMLKEHPLIKCDVDVDSMHASSLTEIGQLSFSEEMASERKKLINFLYTFK